MNFTTQRRVRHRNNHCYSFVWARKKEMARTIPSFRIVSFLEEISTQGMHANGRFYTSTKCNDSSKFN
jgi:hypothetical protein